jgi:hypothetical protein
MNNVYNTESCQENSLRFAQDPNDRYHRQRQEALAWLGDRYLLARPINEKRKTNA